MDQQGDHSSLRRNLDFKNIPDQSLVPRRSQAFKENYKLKKKQPEETI